MEPFEVMVSESQERMLCVVEPRSLDAVLAVCEKWEVERRGDRHRSPTAGACACCATASCSATCRCARSSTTARSTTCARRKPAEPIYAPPRARAGGAGGDAAEIAARAAGEPEHRLAPAAVRAVRLDRAVAHGAPPRAGRRGGARAAPTASALAVSIDGNGRRVAADPYRGTIEAVLECAANLACVGARAARHDQQPQLRQPREAAHRLAADRVRARASARPAARWRRRSSAATSRSTTRARRRPDLPDAGDRHGRAAARRPPRGPARASPQRRRRDRARRARSRRRWPPASSPSCAASALPDGLPEIDLEAARGGARRGPRGGPRAARSASAHDIAEGGLAVALAECCLAGRLGAEIALRGSPGVVGPAGGTPTPAGRRLPPALFGEGPGGFVVSGPEQALRALAERTSRAPDRTRRRRRAADRRWTARAIDRRPRGAGRAHASAGGLLRVSCSRRGIRRSSRLLALQERCVMDRATSAACSGCTRPVTRSRACPSSRCTPSSTAARSRRASPPPTAAGTSSRAASSASSARSSPRTTCARSPASWRSATCATRRPARTPGRTPSPSSARRAPTARAASSRSAHNGNLINASSCTTSCSSAASRSARPLTRRSSPR